MNRKGDTLLFFLFVIAALTLPWSIDATQWAPQGYRLVGPTVLAAGVALLLARSPLPIELAGFLGTILGAEFALQFVGGILPKPVLVWRDLREVGQWLWELAVTREVPGALEPFARSLTHMASQGGILRANLMRWSQAVQEGEVTRDTTFLRLALTFVIWLIVLYAGLELFRRRRAFVGLLPLGVAVISNVAYTGLGITYVYLYLAMCFLIMVWAHMSGLERHWDRRGIDYSAHLRDGAMTTGVFLSGAIIVASLVAPYVRYDRAISYFWETYGPEFENFYDRLDRAFAGRNPIPTATPSPRSLAEHQVYRAPQLERTDVFTVRISDPPPILDSYYEEEMLRMGYEVELPEVPKRYWRERTYDAYTGRGWENDAQQADDWAAETAWKEDLPETTEFLTQTYTIIGDPSGLAFGVNEPVRVDSAPYTVISRDGRDLIALGLAEQQYTVVSRVPDAAIEDLLEAEGEYPAWVAERYLSLENVPEAVQRTAEEVVAEAGAVSRYDKALAIEAYLRQFEYDLEVPPPPAGADLVEYFMFETGAGFCDYSASAMVVMLRSVGVAARYASGYNMGYYDEIRGAWVVQEVNAHAWPEVYFPEHGWIEFEPTPAQATFARSNRQGVPIQRPTLRAPLPIPTVAQAPEEEPVLSPTWWVTVLVVLGIVFLILRPPRFLQSRRRRAPAQVVWSAYRGLLRQAHWVGLGPAAGQTPHEYMQYLKLELARANHDATALGPEIDAIGNAYQRLRYSPAGVSHDDGDRAERAYQRLRRPLWRLLVSRTLRPNRAT